MNSNQYPMPIRVEQERDSLVMALEILRPEVEKKTPIPALLTAIDIALSVLTAPKAEPSRLSELAVKVREIRRDAKEFDGDRRGIWECLEEHEKLLLEEAVKYTSPPVLADMLPPLNEELINILGRPNFTCSWAANILRKGGMVIKRKSEDEQAAVIHFLLGHYYQSGDKWFETADKALSEMAATPEAPC